MTMQLTQLQLTQPVAKLYAQRSSFAPDDVLHALHRFIQEDRFREIMPIDVVDYRHVTVGPVLLLVTHEAYVGLEREGGRIAHFYRQRRGSPEPAILAFRRAAAWALRTGRALDEALSGALALDPGELVVGCDDRLRAPNDAASFAALTPALDTLGGTLFDTPTITHVGEPKGGFRASVRGAATSLDELLLRLER